MSIKAKEVRKYAEKIITKAKKNDLATKRLLISKLGSGGAFVVENIFKWTNILGIPLFILLFGWILNRYFRHKRKEYFN